MMLCLCLATLVAGADEILRFDSRNFDDWTYTRSGYVLSRDLINQDKVNLYKGEAGDFTLVSPLASCTGVGSVDVAVVANSTGYDDSRYSPSLGSPAIEILDAAGNVVSSVVYKFTTRERPREFTVSLPVADVADGRFRVRLACWDANIYSALSVRKVIVTAGYSMADVNRDGTINTADVTALYNYLLQGDTTHALTSDVNGDGSITAGDVTQVYNAILGLSGE